MQRSGPLSTYADVLAYIRNPLIWPLELLFLGSAIWHALLGIRAILLDLDLPTRLLRLADRLMLGLGAIAIVYGVWLTYTLVN